MLSSLEIQRGSAAPAPSPCALERKPAPVPGEGLGERRGLPSVVRMQPPRDRVRVGEGAEEFYLSLYGRGGEPQRAGEGAEPARVLKTGFAARPRPRTAPAGEPA